MFGFQTLACLHDIPVVRSSTNKLQDVYAKAKDKSVLIRFPCNVAESIADKSLKMAVTVANPLVKPLRGPARIIDDFAVEKLRQIEAKYPVINKSTEEVINKLNEKTEPVRNAINTVKDTTTSTIQHGKDTVSNVANATVNTANNVADTVYTFCETHVPGKTVPANRHDFSRRTALLWERITSIIGFPILNILIWVRLLIVSLLLKTKQINDVVLNYIQQKPLLTILPQQVLIYIGGFLGYIATRIQPNERIEIKQQQQQQTRQKQFVSRQTLKPGALVTTQSVVVTKQETVVTRNGYTPSNVAASPPGNDIDKLHAQINPTDVELLYSRLPADVISAVDYAEPLSEGQQLVDGEYETQDYVEDDDSYEQ